MQSGRSSKFKTAQHFDFCIIKWFIGFHIGQNLNFWPTISTRLKILKIDVFYQLQVQSSQISEFWPKIQTLLKFYWLLPNFMIPKLAMVKNLKFGDIISRWLTILKNAIFIVTRWWGSYGAGSNRAGARYHVKLEGFLIYTCICWQILKMF